MDDRAANVETPESIATIDLATLAHTAPTEARLATLGALERACRTSGVFYVRNHGVPAGVIERSVALLDEFFDLPDAERMKIAIGAGESNGYVPLDRSGGEYNDSLSCIGALDSMGAEASSLLPRPNDNKWPERPAGLRECIAEYMHAMHDVGCTLLSAMAESVGASPTWFDDVVGPRDAGAFRARRYPPQRSPSAAVGTAAHEDGPPLALIVQSEVSGLETFIEGRGFVGIPEVPGTLVCQLGLLFSRVTNDRFRPNLHRVVNRDPDLERRSSIYWFPFRTDAIIRTMPTCESSEHPTRYAPIRYDRYLREWIDGLE